jgi:hypothetical protein
VDGVDLVFDRQFQDRLVVEVRPDRLSRLADDVRFVRLDRCGWRRAAGGWDGRTKQQEQRTQA